MTDSDNPDDAAVMEDIILMDDIKVQDLFEESKNDPS
jgi:hypothetical protein